MELHPSRQAVALHLSVSEATLLASFLKLGAEFRLNHVPAFPVTLDEGDEDRSLWIDQVREAALEHSDILMAWQKQLLQENEPVILTIDYEQAELWLITLNHSRLALATSHNWMDQTPDRLHLTSSPEELSDFHSMELIGHLMDYWLHWIEWRSSSEGPPPPT